VVIPWKLVFTAAVGILLGAWWASRRGKARGVSEQIPSDIAIVLAIAAVVSGRLVVLIADISVVGIGALDPRAALTLGAGVSTSGALLGALAAGAFLQRRGKVPEGAWRAAVPPVALGLAVWSLLSLIRGSAAGITAPFPLGWSLGQSLGEGTRVPVGVLEALVFGGFAFAVWRAERKGPTTALARMSGSRLAALLLAVVAATHLIGGVLRPAVVTVDGDIDVLLGVIVLTMALLIVMDLSRRTLNRAAAGAAGVALLLVTLLLVGMPQPGPLDLAGSGGEVFLMDQAESGDGSEPPRWTEADLAAFVRAQDGPIVINVWASWCPPCRAEAPVLRRAALAYGEEVTFLGITADRSAEDAIGFAERYGLPFRSVFDDGLRQALGVAGLPTTVVMRPDGAIVSRILGGLDARSLAAAIDRAR